MAIFAYENFAKLYVTQFQSYVNVASQTIYYALQITQPQLC